MKCFVWNEMRKFNGTINFINPNTRFSLNFPKTVSYLRTTFRHAISHSNWKTASKFNSFEFPDSKFHIPKNYYQKIFCCFAKKSRENIPFKIWGNFLYEIGERNCFALVMRRWEMLMDIKWKIKFHL